MGSLFSSPKSPKPRPIIQSNVREVEIPVSPSPSAEDVTRNNRTESLLKRERGKTGTVLTSLDDLFDSQQQDIPQKRLLGE